MSISYSGITNYGKVTLPSVVGGLGSMNILRDPPKSIMTRRINKVGETSGITSMIDDSGNRACEAITRYSRSQNPMVSVSYGNHGNGNMNGSITNTSGKTAAKLPYRIMQGGAFRPPNVRQINTFPLSRLPRTTTSVYTCKDFPDYLKKGMCPESADKTIGVKSELLKTCIRPTATYSIESPIVENFEVKYVIKNPIKISGSSGNRTIDLTSQTVQTPTKEITIEPMHVMARSTKGSNQITYNNEDNRHMDTSRYLQDPLHTNIQSNLTGDTVRFTDNHGMDTERYLQKTMHSNVISNVSNNIRVTPIDDIMDVDIRTKDIVNISYTAPLSGNTKDEYIHQNIQLEHTRPMTQVDTNIKKNMHVNPYKDQRQMVIERKRPVTHMNSNIGSVQRQTQGQGSRDYNLKPTINAGGFVGRGQKPMTDRMQNVNEKYESRRSEMSRKVNEQMSGRYSH